MVQTSTRGWYSMMAVKAKVNAKMRSETTLQKINLITLSHLWISGYIPIIRLIDIGG